MWRSLCLSLVLLGWIAGPALAEPQLGDDAATCRERQPDAQARQDACERVIADGKAAPKDIALAYAIRGEALLKKRNLDKAIESYGKELIASVGGARKLRLVMLDACRDNPFAANMQHTIELKLVDKGFSDIEPSAGFMIVYAAKHGETAPDGEGADSPFATAVARDVKEPHVEVRKLFDIVRDDVWAATKHAQQPFTYGSPAGREDLYFVTAAATAPPAPQPQAPPAKKR
jgi:hypothetical protein